MAKSPARPFGRGTAAADRTVNAAATGSRICRGRRVRSRNKASHWEPRPAPCRPRRRRLPTKHPAAQVADQRTHRIPPLVRRGDLVARRRADHPPQGHAVSLGSGNQVLVADSRNRVGHARRGAGIGAVRLGDVEEELLLIGAGLLGRPPNRYRSGVSRRLRPSFSSRLRPAAARGPEGSRRSFSSLSNLFCKDSARCGQKQIYLPLPNRSPLRAKPIPMQGACPSPHSAAPVRTGRHFRQRPRRRRIATARPAGSGGFSPKRPGSAGTPRRRQPANPSGSRSCRGRPGRGR